MAGLLRRLVARLPRRWQQDLKRFAYRRKLRKGRFTTGEPEFARLPSLVRPGDWALDIGANIGHYTARLSELVGPEGRVLAFEPVPETFELLAANVALLPAGNVTLINAAASDAAGIAGVSIPNWPGSGLRDYYSAHLAPDAEGPRVLCLPVDALPLPRPVRLVKIDAEGHEPAVLRGMAELLRRDHPTLIVENNSGEVPAYLAGFGYTVEVLPGSDNWFFPTARPEAPG